MAIWLIAVVGAAPCQVFCIFHFENKLIPLFYQNLFSGLTAMVALLNQFDIFCQHFYCQPRTSHTSDEVKPLHVGLVVITDSTFIPFDRRNAVDTFILTQGIGRNFIAFTSFRNLHVCTSHVL